MNDTFTWPVRDPAKGAWFGSEDLKTWVLAKMLRHRADDSLVKGLYQELAPDAAEGYLGCLIGCTLPKAENLTQRRPFATGRYVLPGEGVVEVPNGWDEPHRAIEALYGIPAEVAQLLDYTFEDQDAMEAAGGFAVASIEAIPVGAFYSGEETELVVTRTSDTANVLAFLRGEKGWWSA